MFYAFANSLGRSYVSGLDADAKAYINAIVAAGATVTGAQKTAISDFVAAEKAASRWTSLKRFYFPVWNVAAANAIDMVSLTSGTFVGSVTHAAGYIQGDGSSAYLRYNSTPNALGLTNATGFSLALCSQATTVDSVHAGALEGVTNRCSIVASATTLGAEYTTSGTAIYPSVSRANQTGIMCFSRTSTTSLVLYQRKTSGFSTLATGTNVESTASPNVPVCGMARGRTASTADSFSNGRYAVFCLGLGFSAANVEAFTLNVKTMYETVTGNTLP